MYNLSTKYHFFSTFNNTDDGLVWIYNIVDSNENVIYTIHDSNPVVAQNYVNALNRDDQIYLNEISNYINNK